MTLPTVDDATHFDPKDWSFFWMTQAVGRYLHKLERALKADGLDVSRWRVLMSVGDRTRSVTEIAKLAIGKLPTMLKVVQRMADEGLVRCGPRESDARFTDVSLTAKGQEARKQAWTIAIQLYDVAFRDMGVSDQAALNRQSRHIFERLAD